MNRLIMSVNKKVLDLLNDTLLHDPGTQEILLEFMYLSSHLGSSPISCPTWNSSRNSITSEPSVSTATV